MWWRWLDAGHEDKRRAGEVVTNQGLFDGYFHVSIKYSTLFPNMQSHTRIILPVVSGVRSTRIQKVFLKKKNWVKRFQKNCGSRFSYHHHRHYHDVIIIIIIIIIIKLKLMMIGWKEWLHANKNKIIYIGKKQSLYCNTNTVNIRKMKFHLVCSYKKFNRTPHFFPP